MQVLAFGADYTWHCNSPARHSENLETFGAVCGESTDNMVQEGMVPTTERPEAHVETDHESDTELALWADGTLQQRRTHGKDSRERETASRPEFPL